MTNVDQRDNWNGISGDTWVRFQDRYDRMLEPWGDLLAQAAAVEPGERVLDVGCGCGVTTLAAARRTGGPDGVAVGVDLSEQMVARARQRAQAGGITTARFEVGDCQTDDLGTDSYDVAMSRFGVMFFDDPVAAFANIARAVRPGGRLVFVTWGPALDQEWVTVPRAAAVAHVPTPAPADEDAPGPFSLASAERCTAILHDAGWTDVHMELHQRPELLGGGGTLDETLDFVVHSGPIRLLLADVDEAPRRRAVEAIREALQEHLTPAGVEVTGTAWTVTASR
jgi:ubiquinone/menaquinone biosynthesis C-methylase UbiE